MYYKSERHRRKSLRLKDYDYSQQGLYFVTICSQNRESLFGDIIDGKMILNEYGKIVDEFWNKVPEHFANVNVDLFVIMPNHVHAIIEITNQSRGCRGEGKGEVTSPLLGKIIAYYKYETTKLINQLRDTTGLKIWQRNYYEHIIRNDKELSSIREYIKDNPLKWKLDKECPDKLNI
jgi:REP element-mobilizing transposase RayT